MDSSGHAAISDTWFKQVVADAQTMEGYEFCSKAEEVPSGKLQDVKDAVARLREELDESCLPSCAGNKAEKLLKLLDDPGFTIEYKDMKDCGRSPFWTTLGLGKRIQISEHAWTCCIDQSLHGIDALASTILHEMAHRGQIIPTEGTPRALEANCFGCRVK